MRQPHVRLASLFVRYNSRMHSPISPPPAWARVAQVVWLALSGLSLTLYMRGWPFFVSLLRQPCAGSGCAYGQLAPDVAAGLMARGVSLSAYGALTISLQTLGA